MSKVNVNRDLLDPRNKPFPTGKEDEVLTFSEVIIQALGRAKVTEKDVKAHVVRSDLARRVYAAEISESGELTLSVTEAKEILDCLIDAGYTPFIVAAVSDLLEGNCEELKKKKVKE